MNKTITPQLPRVVGDFYVLHLALLNIENILCFLNQISTADLPCIPYFTCAC